MQMFKQGLYFILLTLGLSGCVSVATTSASAIYNRYAIERQIENKALAMRIQHQLNLNHGSSQSRILVSCFHYQALLTGETPFSEFRQKVATLAANMPKIKHVYNFIAIRPPLTHSEILYDDWLTTKIKTKIIANGQIDPNAIKVLTANKTVYLIGILTHEQADMAVKIAQYTLGVAQVVKIFQYIKLSKV